MFHCNDLIKIEDDNEFYRKISLKNSKKTCSKYNKNTASRYRRDHQESFNHSIKLNYIDEFKLILPENSTVFDFGCGIGPYVNHMDKIGINGYGIDGSQHMIRNAMELYPHISDRFLTGFIEDISKYFKHLSVDGIVIMGVFDGFLPETRRFLLEEIYNHLGKNGKLFMETWERMEGDDEYIDIDLFGEEEKRRHHLIERNEMKILLRESGFNNIEFGPDRKIYEREVFNIVATKI